MADTPVILNNYSDDSQIKTFMNTELAVRVFHDIPLNVLNSGMFSLTTEYISQITEQLSFTSAFYFNESFITKAILPDSIYAEASIFNIGYSFATPASSNFLLELRIADIMNNAVYNADNGLYEFILDKNTKFNLPEGFVYSLDYDILIQFKNEPTAINTHAWNVQYINRDEANMCATNKDIYLHYRTTETWLCIFVQANEYERQTHTVVNNTASSVPSEDTVITCNDHIAGFDIRYIDKDGNSRYLTRDHILTVHDKPKDLNPYVNYIMDNPQTIRFMWQLAGNKYFTPGNNSSYEITIYTCHGKAANAPDYHNDTQPQIITASNRYTNNANVTKAVFVIGSCVGGTDIGNTETIRRETIEAYNTANVISTDHDIDEWLKTFYFKGLIYPFFFKRRDDPWGRIWSGYLALSNENDYVYKTNTLHGDITYDILYANGDNNISNNEIIIPPGWLWTYVEDAAKNRFAVKPYVRSGNKIVENAKSLANISDKFVFANPFGVRIQKDPFAIGYFNLWINQYVDASHVDTTGVVEANLYHASHIISHIRRTYLKDYYDINTTIDTNVKNMIKSGESLVINTSGKIPPVELDDSSLKYFNKPLDEYSSNIPILVRTEDDGILTFDPENTYIYCNGDALIQDTVDDNKYVFAPNAALTVVENPGSTNEKRTPIIIPNSITDGEPDLQIYCYKSLWTDIEDHKVYPSGETDIVLEDMDHNPITRDSFVHFDRVPTMNYYELRLNDDIEADEPISQITVTVASETGLTKYGEATLTKIGDSYSDTGVTINVTYNTSEDARTVTYTISNAANVYMPFDLPPEINNTFTFTFGPDNPLTAGSVILYADMKPSPENGTVSYYRISFAEIPDNVPAFSIASKRLNLSKNNMRVVMSIIMNGSITGRVEMIPTKVDRDGTYEFNAKMYPLTEMIDISNRMTIASINQGGGSWIPVNGKAVTIDATNPVLKISILFRNESEITKTSPFEEGDSFTGYDIVDEYTLNDVNLLQELKEMRSVVNFYDSSIPTEEQISLYEDMFGIDTYQENVDNLYYMTEYAYDRKHNITTVGSDYSEEFIRFQNAAAENKNILEGYFERYLDNVSLIRPEWFDVILDTLTGIINYEEYTLLNEKPVDFDPTVYYKKNKKGEYYHGDSSDTWATGPWYKKNEVDWDGIYEVLAAYPENVSYSFKNINVEKGIEVQLMPFVARTLMISEDFEHFVAAFTQVHKAIEPVIFERLEGNHYLDCKLIATYGRPHSYSADIDIEDPHKFWPDLGVQIEFDVKVYNLGLKETTISDLKQIIRSYFNRITTVHTPTQNLSMDNNIYISNLIQLMEEHDNVAYLRFKGWYTNEKGDPYGNYMDPSVQAIEQKWRKLEDMPTDELERYVPEMFLLEPNNIVINVIK